MGAGGVAVPYLQPDVENEGDGLAQEVSAMSSHLIEVVYWLEREIRVVRQPREANELVVSTLDGSFLIDRESVPDSDTERYHWLADLVECWDWKLSSWSMQLHIPEAVS
ncbi:MAG: hypothetical protein ACPG77_10095 [Nannocystaceae bacterium]